MDNIFVVGAVSTLCVCILFIFIFVSRKKKKKDKDNKGKMIHITVLGTPTNDMMTPTNDGNTVSEPGNDDGIIEKMTTKDMDALVLDLEAKVDFLHEKVDKLEVDNQQIKNGQNAPND